MDGVRALLLAEDDERRAIERELHDGVQQQLIALAVDLQLARQLVASDPGEAARLLDDARADVKRALDEVRRLAERVHPPLIDTQGLAAALRMAAASARMPTVVEVNVEIASPPELALTVYRCCVATLDTAGGERARAHVTLAGDDEMLEFELTLEGAAIDGGRLDVLEQRVRLLGGVLEVAPTRVFGRLPLPS